MSEGIMGYAAFEFEGSDPIFDSEDITVYRGYEEALHESLELYENNHSLYSDKYYIVVGTASIKKEVVELVGEEAVVYKGKVLLAELMSSFLYKMEA